MAIPCSPARVLSARRLSPNLIRIRFEAVGGWLWHTDGVGDERIDIALPAPGETTAALHVFNSPEYGRGWTGEEPPWRHYTVRAVHDGGLRFDIDFVVHPGGVASAWAERAEPGHLIGVFDEDRSSSYYAPPGDARAMLLVADATGLPGLGRIVEGLPAEIVASAIIEVADPGDVQGLSSDARLSVDWVVGSGNGIAPSALPERVARFLDPGEPWYAWIACEAAASRAIRRDLRTRLGLPRDRHHAIGYWTQDLAGDRPAEIG